MRAWDDRRRAGVLLHPTSLPSGDLGNDAHRFVDWLAAAGVSVWQVLPLGPVGPDGSPYQSDSAYAGNPALVAPGPLVEDGLLNAAECDGDWLGCACTQFAARAGPALRDAYARFAADASGWLDDYARYRVAKSDAGGAPWWQWSEGLRRCEPAALAALDRDRADALERVRVAQFLFERQWQALRAHAHARGVALFGDMPIFVAHDSAEVWLRPELFSVDEDGRAAEVAGVPPDYFSRTGQRWGNPLYRWDALAADGFAWWIERLRGELRRVDLLRVDHFRGFAACWAIPAHSDSAVHGRWVEVPGRALFDALGAALGRLPLVAEDLGLITPDVVALREAYRLPGMRVLQFAFDGGADNPYLPFNHTADSVVYTGTHDNDTALGWWRSLDDARREYVLEVLGRPAEAMPWALVRAALGSVGRLAVVPLQDLLGLDGAHRMNTPATTTGNWRWRFAWEQFDAGLAERIARLVALYGRAA